MRAMTYDKAKVTARLRENMAAHRDKVLRSQEVYQQKVTEELEHRLDQAKNGHPVDPGFLQHFPIPQDYTREYERVIDRLETTDDKTVTLDDNEFNQYMRDEWDWQARFTASNSTYLAS